MCIHLSVMLISGQVLVMRIVLVVYMTVVVALVVVVYLAMVLVVFCWAKKKIRSPMNICSNTKIKYIHFHLSHIKSGMLVYPQKSCEL